jgi:AraC-like DNA-binding protein
VNPTIRASVLTGYAQVARSVGLDPLRMLDAVGLPREALSDPDLRVSGVAVGELFENSSRAAEDFGLLMYDVRTPSGLGPVALIAREQPTVRAALDAVSRHLSLHSEVTTLAVQDVDGVTVVRVAQPLFAPHLHRQAADLSMGQLMRFLRLMLGPDWRPLNVWFVHGPPKVLDNYRRIFGPNLAFNQAFNGVFCDAAEIARPNPAADPEMARQIERYIAGLGARAEGGIAKRVRELVIEQLPTGKCTGERAAQLLSMDLRMLQRQLAAAGTSFGDIVQAVRMHLAPQYLEPGGPPLVEVAERLGFSALSAFSRWHRTHYGKSPSAGREAFR